MLQLARNLSLTARTALEHMGDDPMVFWIQVSRRLPLKFTGPAARLVRTVSSCSTSVPAALADYVSGDLAGLERRAHRALAGGISHRRARGLAEVALAAGRPKLAESLVAAQSARANLGQSVAASGPVTSGPLASEKADHAALLRTQARMRWYAGEMSAAVELLKRAGKPAAHQLTRYQSELNVFSGWRPTLTEQANFQGRPNRVLHVVTNSLPHTGSGYAQRTHSVLKSLQEAGTEVLAVTRLGYPVQVGKLLAGSSDVVDGVRYERLLPAALPPLMHQRLQRQAELVLDHALKFQPEVLHTTTHFANALVTSAVADSLGIPWVYEVRGQMADTWASSRGPEAVHSERYRLFTTREAEAVRGADHVVTLGQRMRDRIVDSGVPGESVSLAPNAVGESFLQPPVAPAQARAALGLPREGVYVGTVSSLVDYEGLGTLLEAFASIAEHAQHTRLLIVGSGASLPALQAQARALGITDKVVFTGRVPREQAAMYHQALDVFVVPRIDSQVTRDVTPLKPVEAMASARPVVASDLPALRELVHDGETGLLVPPEDPLALAQALERLIEDAALRGRLGKAGREQMLAERTWAATSLVYQGIYQRERARWRSLKGQAKH